jgi:hypothetical protein
MTGKRRVVGITDNWTQFLFRPLHDAIYAALYKVAEDGTSDQLGPVKILLESLKGKDVNLNSVDLSAATDRLPVNLQADILCALGLPGKEWQSILRRGYRYGNDTYLYEVGQPMGAYSSFAMLALTNHVIMMLAFSESGIQFTKKDGMYAILGDDVAIRDSSVAASYTKIMTDLGVEINPIKGFRGSILEFAKRVFHYSNCDLSPLGGKITLRASRDPIYIPALLKDFSSKGFAHTLTMELSIIRKLLERSFNKIGLNQAKYLYVILGPQSGLWNLSDNNDYIGALHPTAVQILFNEFITELGIEYVAVARLFCQVAQRHSIVSLIALKDCYRALRTFIKFIWKPYVWNPRRFKNDPNLPAPVYAAGLTAASIWIISLPFIILVNLRYIFRVL